MKGQEKSEDALTTLHSKKDLIKYFFWFQKNADGLILYSKIKTLINTIHTMVENYALA